MNSLYGMVIALSLTHVAVAEFTLFYTIKAVGVDCVQPMADAVQASAVTNAHLVEKVERAKDVVEAVTQENSKLKCSLSESVEMLKEEIEENNRLNDELANSRWRIQVLEKLVSKLSESEEITLPLPGPEELL